MFLSLVSCFVFLLFYICTKVLISWLPQITFFLMKRQRVNDECFYSHIFSQSFARHSYVTSRTCKPGGTCQVALSVEALALEGVCQIKKNKINKCKCKMVKSCIFDQLTSCSRVNSKCSRERLSSLFAFFCSSWLPETFGSYSRIDASADGNFTGKRCTCERRLSKPQWFLRLCDLVDIRWTHLVDCWGFARACVCMSALRHLCVGLCLPLCGSVFAGVSQRTCIRECDRSWGSRSLLNNSHGKTGPNRP